MIHTMVGKAPEDVSADQRYIHSQQTVRIDSSTVTTARIDFSIAIPSFGLVVLIAMVPLFVIISQPESDVLMLPVGWNRTSTCAWIWVTCPESQTAQMAGRAGR